MMVAVRFMTFQELIAAVGPGIHFTVEELISQMSASLDTNEDFLLTHHDVRYGVKVEDIKAYFETHARPERKLSQSQELEIVKRQLADAERELTTLRGQQIQKKASEMSAPVATEIVNPEGGVSLEDIQKKLASQLADKKAKPLNKT